MTSSFLSLLFKKIIEVGLSLFTLSALTFLFLRLLPGGPFDEDTPLHPLVQEQIEKSWHLQAGWMEQFYYYVGGLLQGDLGVSMLRPERKVAAILAQGMTLTLGLNSFALIFILFFAFLLSYLWAWNTRPFLRSLIEQILISLVSLPSLFLAPFLIYLFSFYFNLLPVAFLTSPRHYILPVLALALRPMASLGRLLQRSLAEQMTLDYVRAARAKGLRPGRILIHHVFRNSLIPALSYAGPLVVSMLSGSFLIEMLFAIPGLGSEFVKSLAERDYTVICGLTLFYGSLLILVNALLDFWMLQLDPRLRERP